MRILYCFFLLLAGANAQGMELHTLAHDPEWQALLHINRGATLHDRGESYVDDAKFFLSAQGKTDAFAELQADIAALAPAQAEARCRFPARYGFLARKLGWQESQPLAHCTDYLSWRQQIPSARAVLVFPASYLNSPSSMFGHTLLRLDASTAPDNVWNSWAVNFGADTRGQDNSLLYVWRGLGGGYPGHFSIVPYISKIQEYSNLENRDIWEYSLNLNDAERARLIDHLWELRDINFDYYFFDENCAFRLLELIDVARPGDDVIQGLRVFEEPVNTVRTLYQHGLVQALVYRPSKAMELQADIAALSPGEKNMAQRLLTEPDYARDPAFQTSAPERQHLMARTALRTLRFKERKHERTDSVAERGLQLLHIMQATPAANVAIPTPAPPEAGHSTQLLGMGGGIRDAQGFAELRYRLTYHDLIDNPPGFLQGAQIEGLDMRLRYNAQDSLTLESLELINIRSLSPRNAFIQPLSWTVQAGWEHAPVYGQSEILSYVQGGGGLSWRWGRLQPFALALLRAEHDEAYRPFIELGAGSSVGLLWYSPQLQIKLQADGFYFENGEYRLRNTLDLNLPAGRQNALRLEARQDFWRHAGDHAPLELSLGWRHFFD